MSRKIVRHFSLEEKKRKAPFVERKFDSRTTYSDSPRNPRREISELGFIGSHSPRGSLQSSSRFPKLVFQNAVRKKSSGVVNLDTQCERKYRSWSDPSGQYTGNWDNLSREGTFDKEVQATWTMFPRLVTAVDTEKENFDEKSFCDSLSSFPCSSITSESPSRSVLTDEDEEDFFISKRKTVFSWVQHSGSSRKGPEFQPVCDLH